jgi:ribonucleoside-triphosphate reductase
MCKEVIFDMERSRCEVWSRVVGYLRPTCRWNEGKVSEFEDRKVFELKKPL